MSTKPWEEDWSVHATHGTWVVKPSPYAPDGSIIGTFDCMGERAATEAARTRLAAAAPDMARALLAVLEVHEDEASSGAHEFARESLRKAGVL